MNKEDFDRALEQAVDERRERQARLPRTLDQLIEEVKRKTRIGSAVTPGMVTDFPIVPPSGMAYSKNFARALKDGPFALQIRD